MQIYLFRHGEIDRAGERRLIGHTDVALSETGKRQALWWRIALKNVEFQQIYSSSLVRSLTTADILAQATKRSVIVEPNLCEINLGKWEGLTAEEVQSKFPGEWENRGLNIAEYRPEQGESFFDLFERVVPTLNSLIDESEESIAVVGHAGVNRVLLCSILGMPIAHLFHIRQDYGALNIINYSRKSGQVQLMNLTPESASAYVGTSVK